METRLLLIRHGATDYSLAGRYAGLTDVPLNGQGITQANRLGRRLADQAVAAVYSSPLQRAYHTARLVFDHRPQTVEPMADWREIHYGLWEGLTYKEVAAGYPDVYRRWREAPELVAIPGGEKFADFQGRVLNAVAQLRPKHHGETIAVVSHGGPIKVILSHVLEMPPRNLHRIKLDFTSISVVEYYDDTSASVCTINDVAHLCRL